LSRLTQLRPFLSLQLPSLISKTKSGVVSANKKIKTLIEAQEMQLKWWDLETRMRKEVKDLITPVIEITHRQDEAYLVQQKDLDEIVERIGELENLFNKGKTKEDRFSEVSQQFRTLVS
jgi:hypothetical protein